MQAALDQVDMASNNHASPHHNDHHMGDEDQHQALDMFMAMTKDEAKEKLHGMD